MTKPTKEQFQEYVVITGKGVSNLFDGKYICEQSTTGLTPDICMCITKHFTELAREFKQGVDIHFIVCYTYIVERQTY